MGCGLCPICNRRMRRTPGGCICSLHPENGIFPEIEGKPKETPAKSEQMERSTKGSKAFSKGEIKAGYRKL